MKRLSAVALAVVGLGLLGSGLHGMTVVDARLSDAVDRPAQDERVIRQEIRSPGDCPWREHREEMRLRDQRAL